MPRRNQGAKLHWREDRGAYYITWTVNGRSRKCATGTADREQAESIFAEWLQARGRRSGPSDPAQTLITDILGDYLKAREEKVAAPGRIAYAVLALTDFFESNTIADVTPPVCERYAVKRGRSAGTVRRELGVLRAAINWAHKNGRITRPVCVELPERPASRDRWLTRGEAARLLRASSTPQARLYMPLFILLGLYTGRRKEAILSLRWPQVNLDAGNINFDVAGRKQTNKKRGTVRIPARLMPHLKRARRRGTDLGYVLHDHGKRIGDIKKGFAAACKRAGIEGVTPHTLRHTAATWLMQAGVPTWQASGFLSMSEETLQRVYGHHHPDYMQEAADAIGRRPGHERVANRLRPHSAPKAV
jgi:integrase